MIVCFLYWNSTVTGLKQARQIFSAAEFPFLSCEIGLSMIEIRQILILAFNGVHRTLLIEVFLLFIVFNFHQRLFSAGRESRCLRRVKWILLLVSFIENARTCVPKRSLLWSCGILSGNIDPSWDFFQWGSKRPKLGEVGYDLRYMHENWPVLWDCIRFIDR